MKRAPFLLAVVSLLTIQAQAALTTAPMAPVAAADRDLTPSTPQSYQSVDYPTVTEARTGEYVLGQWELHPGIGFTAVNSTAGFNVGSHIAYRVTDEYPLHFEPGIWMTFIESRARFNFTAGMRYDLELAKTWLKPFARVALGPTVQTKGDSVVFNAYVGLGVLYPVNRSLDFRADAGMQNVDGDAGFLMTAGIGF